MCVFVGGGRYRGIFVQVAEWVGHRLGSFTELWNLWVCSVEGGSDLLNKTAAEQWAATSGGG